LIKDDRVEASIARCNGWNGSWYDTLFIEQEILSAEFWNSDVDEVGEIGGALGIGDDYSGPERIWVVPVEEFEIDKIMVILAGQAYGNGAGTDEDFQSMKEILDFDAYEFSLGRFGPALVALEIANQESLQEKWGFSTNERSEQYVRDGFFGGHTVSCHLGRLATLHLILDGCFQIKCLNQTSFFQNCAVS
jgi:hypothetical protein